jgi:hypothetical protein
MAEFEHAVKVFPIDDSLDASVRALVTEGWVQVPGVPPVAVYSVIREKKAESGEKPEGRGMGAFGKLQIDDSKVTVIPAGKNLQ